MEKAREIVSLKTRVPVFTSGYRSPELQSQPSPVGLNSLHEGRLITSLIEYYGWTLCSDGNLYNPNPAEAQGVERVA